MTLQRRLPKSPKRPRRSRHRRRDPQNPSRIRPTAKLINAALADQLPKKPFKKPKRLAIDLVPIPCHGTIYRNINEVYRSQPKSDTSRFHAHATVCVLHKGFRYTVALAPVVKGEAMEEVLKRLLKQCRSIGLRCKLLLLDRGF